MHDCNTERRRTWTGKGKKEILIAMKIYFKLYNNPIIHLNYKNISQTPTYY